MGSDGEISEDASRRRTDADRQAIVAEAFGDGNSVNEVAERHGVSTASIYLWRRQAREGTFSITRKAQGRPHPPSPVTLVPVQISAAAETRTSISPVRSERIEIALANGRVLRVCESIDPVRLAHLVRALESTAP